MEYCFSLCVSFVLFVWVVCGLCVGSVLLYGGLYDCLYDGLCVWIVCGFVLLYRSSGLVAHVHIVVWCVVRAVVSCMCRWTRSYEFCVLLYMVHFLVVHDVFSLCAMLYVMLCMLLGCCTFIVWRCTRCACSLCVGVCSLYIGCQLVPLYVLLCLQNTGSYTKKFYLHQKEIPPHVTHSKKTSNSPHHTKNSTTIHTKKKFHLPLRRKIQRHPHQKQIHCSPTPKKKFHHFPQRKIDPRAHTKNCLPTLTEKNSQSPCTSKRKFHPHSRKNSIPPKSSPHTKKFHPHKQNCTHTKKIISIPKKCHPHQNNATHTKKFHSRQQKSVHTQKISPSRNEKFHPHTHKKKITQKKIPPTQKK